MEGFLAAVFLHATDVAVLGVGLELHEHFPHRGVGGGHTGAGSCGHQGLGGRGAVPAQAAGGGRSSHVGSELQELEVGADAVRAVGLLGVADAGHGLECQLVHAVGEPVAQHVAAVATELDDGLLVGHAAFVAVGVTQLVDADDLVKGLHRFFVAFQRAVARHAVAGQVGQQRDDCAGALLGLLQLGDVLNQAVRALAQEAVDEGVVAGLFPQVHRPDGLLLGRQEPEIGECHGGALSLVDKNDRPGGPAFCRCVVSTNEGGKMLSGSLPLTDGAHSNL